MANIVAAIDCALDNNIFGDDTVSRFSDFSQYYWVWAVTYFTFLLFIDPEVTAFLNGLTFWTWTLGGGSIWILIPYEIITHYGAAFFTLYWSNEVYNAFHPVIAKKEMKATDMMEDWLEWMQGKTKGMMDMGDDDGEKDDDDTD